MVANELFFLIFSDDALVRSVNELLLVLSFRSFPFCAWYVLSPKHTALARLGVAFACGAIAWLQSPTNHVVLVHGVAGFAYYAVAAGALHWLSKEPGTLRSTDSVMIFATIPLVFIVLPATLLRFIAHGSFQFIGWELLFKGYSYVLENGSRSQSLRNCLFFFLVDPTIVYAHRARAASYASPVPKPLRLLIGIIALFLFFLVIHPIVGFCIALNEALRQGATLMTLGFVQLIAAYSQHSGVASIQIGLLALAGVRARERYRYPLFALSPADFWRRWNTYIGEWAYRYIYFPVSVRMLRALGGRCPRQVVIVLAVLCTFAVVGLLHDVYSWAERQSFTLSGFSFFFANAILLLAWEASTTIGRLWIRVDADSLRWAMASRTLKRSGFLILFSILIGVSTTFK